MQLQHEMSDMGWGYVSNPSGGFLGAWWHSHEWEGCDVYLQIEQGPLCFKVGVKDKTQGSMMRHRWYEELMKVQKEMPLLPLKRPQRFGSGWTMTVAIIDMSEWLVTRSNGTLDMSSTLSNLKKAEKLLDGASLKNCISQNLI